MVAGNNFAFSQENSQKETLIVIHTDYGDITAKLYNDTPQHRDNFIKLINEGWYEGSPFHRIIKNFMIQGGGNADGKQDPGYRIPAEINPKHYHKKEHCLLLDREIRSTPKGNHQDASFI